MISGLQRLVEFLIATIRNPNTRRAYDRAVGDFFAWCDEHGLALIDIEPVHVATYVELLGRREEKPLAVPSVKQHLAAICMLFDYLVTGQVVPFNPATAVRGPKHVVGRGKTPVLTADQARVLLDSIETSTLIGLRDRALIGVMVFSFARINAALGMKVADYYVEGRKAWFRLHEKGDKRHEVPAHHNAADYMDAYLAAAGIAEQKKSALFRSIAGRGQKLTDRPLDARNAFDMIKRRALAVNLPETICNHTFRATGITAYRANGGTLEKAHRCPPLRDRAGYDVPAPAAPECCGRIEGDPLSEIIIRDRRCPWWLECHTIATIDVIYYIKQILTQFGSASEQYS